VSDSPYIFEGTPDNFHDLVIQGSHDVPVLVDFWAAWCNPCQMLMPIVTRLAEQYQGKLRLVKVNSDEQQALAAQFGVRNLPTLKLFRNGKVVEEIMGAQPESSLRELLDQYIERESDHVATQAMHLAQAGKLDEAMSLLQQAMNDDPDNQRIPLDLARLTVMTGDYDGAQSMISKLPAAQRETPEARELVAQMHFARIILDSPEPRELASNIEKDPADLDSRQRLAAWLALEGDYEAALLQLLEIMKTDPGWDEDAGRKGMLTVFELLGGEGELVARYRRQMFNLLH